MSASIYAQANGLKLHSENDALDVLGSGLPACIFTAEDLHPEFFDLANQIAGIVMQKFVNYNFKVAFVVPDDHSYGERVTELMRDHARHPCIRFFATAEQAEAWLS